MKIFVSFSFIFLPFLCWSQKPVTKSIKDFGAKGNGKTDDQDAFKKASAFFNGRKGHGKLIIPKGTYIVGRQKFTGADDKKQGMAYVGEYVLELNNCDQFAIEAQSGVVLKHRDSLRLGTFSPKTGQSFRHNIKDIQTQAAYSSYATIAGCMIFLNGCSNIKISGLKLNGNSDNFKFGGNWGIGRNPFELIHYGIYLMDSHDVKIQQCVIENFACDGIYISNMGQQVKTYKINIDNCRVNFSGRNGLSWIGGENIRVTNSTFSNSGRGVVHESPGAGIDIEMENSSFCRNGYFYNCRMINNVGSGITSGSGAVSSDVLFEKCIVASPEYYSVFVNAASHVFRDCKFYGTVLVWYMAEGRKDAVKFKQCLFDENYEGKKMYDGNYQLGTEGTAVEIDSCSFRAYSTSSYYLAAHARDCNADNPQKNKVSNCSFYNYAESGFKIAEKVAGMAYHTIFYNNSFYSRPGIRFQNAFEANCNADAGKNQFFTTMKK